MTKETVRRVAELEAALKESERELAACMADFESFSYVVTHDLKESARGISSFIAILEREHGAEMSEAMHDLFTFVQRSSIRLNKRIDALHELASVRTKPLRVQEVELDVVVKDALAGLGDRSAAVSVNGPLPRVRGDVRLLGRMFSALLHNAVTFASDEPRVEVSATTAAHAIEVCVRDHGIGIAPEHHAAVFEIFRRLHGREAYGGGLGMGLAVAKRIAERHGGRISVRPGEGAGTELVVRFALV